ncbi:MAG: heparinase II/III family protein, partial [Clostridium sp.]
MKIFDILDLNYPGLEKVKDCYEKGKFEEAKRELKEYFTERKTVKGFIKNKAFFKKIIDEDFIEDKEAIIKVASEVRNKEFIFTLPWEMERCHKKVSFEN